MGLFRKKPDPISERAKHLNNQIAALEAEIQRLAEEKETPPPAPQSSSPFAEPSTSAPKAPKPQPKPVPARPAPQKSQQPRLRSTAVPHGLNVPAASPSPAPAQAHEPIFEEVDQDRIQSNSEPVTPAHFNELGVRKYDMASAWKRVKTHFQGPVASNPKLVHYLSAGSIQGLRPMRYEKRVARNRFIVLAVFLVLALWGIIAIFMSRR